MATDQVQKKDTSDKADLLWTKIIVYLALNYQFYIIVWVTDYWTRSNLLLQQVAGTLGLLKAWVSFRPGLLQTLPSSQTPSLPKLNSGIALPQATSVPHTVYCEMGHLAGTSGSTFASVIWFHDAF